MTDKELRIRLGIIIWMLCLVLGLLVGLSLRVRAQTLLPDGRILVSVDTAWKAYFPEEWAGPARAMGFYGIDSAFDDSSNWWCEVVCDTVYDGSLRWDSTVFTGRDGKVFGTLYPCDTTWHRKQCLMVTPEEERQLRELLQSTKARKP